MSSSLRAREDLAKLKEMKSDWLREFKEGLAGKVRFG